MTIPLSTICVGEWCRKTLAYRIDVTKAPREMQARLPNAKLVTFEGYGHRINLLIPDRCVAEMRAFLRQPVAA